MKSTSRTKPARLKAMPERNAQLTLQRNALVAADVGV